MGCCEQKETPTERKNILPKAKYQFKKGAKSEVVVNRGAKRLQKADSLQKWEAELPFGRIPIRFFCITIANLLERNDGQIKFDQFKDSFRGNPAFFKELNDKSSPSSKILTSHLFSDDDDSIDSEMLQSLALLYCKSDVKDTPYIFSNVSPGEDIENYEAHPECFERMCQIVLGMVQFYTEDTENQIKFSDEEIQKMLFEEYNDLFEDWRKDVFLDNVSELKTDEFVQRCCDKNN